MSNTSKKVSSKKPVSKTSNKKPAAKKAAYVSREEYKAKFERQMSLVGKNAAKLTVISEANHQLNRTLTGEIKKVTHARDAYKDLTNKYDSVTLKLNNSENQVVILEEVIVKSLDNMAKFECLSTFRKVVVVITDSVTNYIR
jgi:PHD/YefM family antitoxin component YafN of YafNO toxin-antitoxin module